MNPQPNPASRLVESAGFNRFITGVILFAALVIGLETYPAVMDRYKNLLLALNNVVLVIFALEVVVRMAAEWPRPWRYFRQGWNIFDFLIVVGSLLPGIGAYAIVARLLRLLRVLRLIRTVPELQVILGALIRALPSMGFVLLLLLLYFYVYSVAGVFLFGPNDPVHFPNLHTAMLSLFGVLTLEGWTNLMSIQYFGCARFELPFPELCTSPQAQPTLAVIYFVSFVLLGTMIFLNLLVGIVVNSMDEMRKAHEKTKERPQSPLETDLAELQAKLGEMQELVHNLEGRLKR